MSRYNTLNRRQFAKLCIGLTALLATPKTMAKNVSSSDGPELNLRDHCYWVTKQTAISDGRRWEYRCEICCAGGVCEVVGCTWINVGPA